jgi:hypothetical protein
LKLDQNYGFVWATNPLAIVLMWAESSRNLENSKRTEETDTIYMWSHIFSYKLQSVKRKNRDKRQRMMLY